MKVSRAIDFCLKYHKINSRPNTVANYEFILKKFEKRYSDQDILSITTEEIIVSFRWLQVFNRFERFTIQATGFAGGT